jgi:hypothetical protein
MLTTDNYLQELMFITPSLYLRFLSLAIEKRVTWSRHATVEQLLFTPMRFSNFLCLLTLTHRTTIQRFVLHFPIMTRKKETLLIATVRTSQPLASRTAGFLAHSRLSVSLATLSSFPWQPPRAAQPLQAAGQPGRASAETPRRPRSARMFYTRGVLCIGRRVVGYTTHMANCLEKTLMHRAPFHRTTSP